MDSKFAVGFLALAVVLAGCVHAGNQADGNDNAPSGDGQAPAEKLVTYSSSGFSPQTITIQQGETVTWESQGPRMWVASDVHPVHSQYDGTSLNEHCPNDGGAFDSCEARDTYSFTFTRTGQFSYHNHVGSGSGTVVVE